MQADASKGFLQILRANPAIVAVCVATALSMMGQGIIVPVLPLFAREFGVSATAIGLVVGVFGMGRILFNLPAGFLAQRFGRKAVMGTGLVLAAIGAGLSGTSIGVPQLVGWRFLQGVGSALFVTSSFAYIADISTSQNRGRFMSLQQGSLLLGVDLGPTLGGFVADMAGFRWPFYISGILAALSAVWIFARLPEAPAERAESSVGEGRATSRSTDRRTVVNLLQNPTFFLVSLFTLLIFFTRTGSMHSLLPLLAVDRLDISATQLGLLFTTATTLNFLLVLPVGALTDRLGRKVIILPGTVLSVLALLLYAGGNSLWIYYGAAAVYGIGVGMIGPAPAAYAGDLAPPGRTAITMGLYRSFGDIGFVAGPILLGWIADLTSFGTSMVSNAAMLLAVGVVLMVVAKETAGRRRPASPKAAGGRGPSH